MFNALAVIGGVGVSLIILLALCWGALMWLGTIYRDF